jgi:hypothetical protein
MSLLGGTQPIKMPGQFDRKSQAFFKDTQYV